MTLAILTAEFPYGKAESFLEDELQSLQDWAPGAVLIPLRSWGKPRRHVEFVSIEEWIIAPSFRSLIVNATAEAIRRPFRLLGVLSVLLSDRRHLLKNLVVLPFGLALAHGLRHQRLDNPHLHAHWLSTNATVALIAARLEQVPFSVTAHRWDIVDDNLGTAKAREAEFIRFISQSGLQLHKDRHPECNAIRQVVHLGISLNDLKWTMLPQELNIAVPANMYPVKGLHVIIDALAALHAQGVTAHASFFGDGELKPRLVEQVRSHSLEGSVTFEGHVAREDLLRRYEEGEFRVVALPSLDLGAGTHEGIPVSLMEAMSHGVPVVSTFTGGIPELIDNEVSGRLVRPNDSESLAAALLSVAEDNPALEKQRRAARAKIELSFNASKSAEILMLLVNGATKKGSE